jgi:hypothetical protein
MIGVNQHADSAHSILLVKSWLAVIRAHGFDDRVADVGGPYSAPWQFMKAARINKPFAEQAKFSGVCHLITAFA